MEVKTSPGMIALLLVLSALLGAAVATLAEERRMATDEARRVAAETTLEQAGKLADQASQRANNALERVMQDKAILEECTSQLDHLRREDGAFK